MGKIIVIDGVDGSGKGTQCKLLKERLKEENYTLYSCSFPRYQDEASIFVRRYLNGDYGTKPSDVSAYQASLCYAMDRYDFFKTNKEAIDAMLDPNVIMVTDCYTTSNLIHQGTKIQSLEEQAKFNDWLWHLEYEILGIPKPDMVIIPVLEPNANLELVRQRNIANRALENKMSTDIHEADMEYLKQTIESSRVVVEQMGFDVIDCMNQQGGIRTIEDIHEEIYRRVENKVLRKIRKKP